VRPRRGAVPVAIALLLGTASCGAPRGQGGSREPVRWILVEKRYGKLPEGGVLPEEGRIDQEGVYLAFEPVYAGDGKGVVWGNLVELLEVTPSGAVAPGEVVTVRLRVGNAEPGVIYRLIARPLLGDVRIVGEAEARVRGAEEALFRFTRLSGGRGGIEVGVSLLSFD
jgi:hypothetical protein